MIENKEFASYSEIISLIKEFNNDETVLGLKTKYEEESFLDILSISRKEKRHTSFIVWLLDPKRNEELFETPFKKLLNFLISKSGKEQFDYSNDLESFYESIILEDYEIDVNDFEVIKERSIGKGNEPDIVVICPVKFKSNEGNTIRRYYNLLIENKVESDEGADQTKKYFEQFSSFLKKDKEQKEEEQINMCVYLSIEGNEALSSEKFTHITYQELLENVIEPSYKMANTQRIKFILSEYIKTLGQGNYTDKVMALGTKEKKLLVKFWEKNSKLIEMSLEAVLLNDEISEEDYESTKNLLNEIKNQKIGQHVRININQVFEKNKIDENMLKNLLNKDYSTETFNLSYPLLRKVDKDDAKVDRYWKSKIEYNGKYYVVCSEWYERMRQKFNKWLEEIE